MAFKIYNPRNIIGTPNFSQPSINFYRADGSPVYYTPVNVEPANLSSNVMIQIPPVTSYVSRSYNW